MCVSVCVFSPRIEESLCPTNATKGMKEEQEWQTQKLIQVMFCFSDSLILILVHRIENIKDRIKKKKASIFSITEYVLHSEKMQKFIGIFFNCLSHTAL